MLFRPLNRYLTIALAVLLLTAVFKPMPMALVFGTVVAALAFLRWQTWSAEWIVLTSKRIIRIEGVPETTSSESSLRVDRISGARLVQTVPGKILGYGTIDLEAPGDHPEVRRLHQIADARRFYLQLRRLVFGDDVPDDPDDEPGGGKVVRGGFVPDPYPPNPYRSSTPYAPTPPAPDPYADHVTQPLPPLDPQTREQRPRE